MHLHVYKCVHVSLYPALCLLATHTTLSSRMHLHVGRRAEEETRIKGKEKRRERLMEGGSVKARDETQIGGGWRNGGKKMEDREAEEKVK